MISTQVQTRTWRGARRQGAAAAAAKKRALAHVDEDPAATLDDLREAVTTLEDAERIARRVLGSAHPTTANIERNLQNARAALRARETPSLPEGV